MQAFNEINIKYFLLTCLHNTILSRYIYRVMMTIADYAEKRGVPIQTVYSWIYRSKAEEKGFKVIQVGSIKLIEEIKSKKKAA